VNGPTDVVQYFHDELLVHHRQLHPTLALVALQQRDLEEHELGHQIQPGQGKTDRNGQSCHRVQC